MYPLYFCFSLEVCDRSRKINSFNSSNKPLIRELVKNCKTVINSYDWFKKKKKDCRFVFHSKYLIRQEITKGMLLLTLLLLLFQVPVRC